MGQYKVPQDVEAEDTIIGPLTMRQFIYAIIGAVWGGLSYLLFKGLPVVFVLIGIPPTLLFFLLAFYKRQDQPFEAYLLALIGYVANSRWRIWEKEPIEEVFKIEAPQIEPQVARLDSKEVRSRLEQLARMIDTRGHAPKTTDLQEPGQTPTLEIDDRDRLVMPEFAQVNPLEEGADVDAADDIFDMQNNPSAQSLGTLIQDTQASIRQEALAKMRSDSAPSPAPAQPPTQSISGMTPNPVAGILKLAMESDDLTVSQISSQAQRQQSALQEGQSVNLRDGQATAEQ
jgi:hypothetical protein